MSQSVVTMMGNHADSCGDSRGLGAPFFVTPFKDRGKDTYDANVEAAWQRADLIRKEKGQTPHICNVCGGTYHRNCKVASTCGRTKCRYEWKKIKNRDRMANGYVASRPTKRIPCANCNRMFLPPKHSVVCCSPECQAVRKKLTRMAYSKGAKLCVVCGGEFVPYRPTQKCCGKPDCVKEVDRRAMMTRRRTATMTKRLAGDEVYKDPSAPAKILGLHVDDVKVEGLPFDHALCTPMG